MKKVKPEAEKIFGNLDLTQEQINKQILEKFPDGNIYEEEEKEKSKEEILAASINNLIIRLEKIEKKINEPARQNYIPSGTYQQENPLGQLGTLIQALAALQGYNNTVLDNYRKIKADIVADLTPDTEAEDFEEITSNPEDSFMSILTKSLLSREKGTVQPPATPEGVAPVPSEQKQNNIIVPNSNKQLREAEKEFDEVVENLNIKTIPEVEKVDTKIIAKGVPDSVKIAVKSGALTLEGARKILRASEYSDLLNDDEIEKIYKEIKEN